MDDSESLTGFSEFSEFVPEELRDLFDEEKHGGLFATKLTRLNKLLCGALEMHNAMHFCLIMP